MDPGLVSVTFRQRSPSEVITLCVENRLSLIEWGGDVHVPHGDLRTAERVGVATRQSGLTVSAYGSYFQLGKSEQDGLSFSAVLETAVVLGSPAIRVWPGAVPSTEATPVSREAIYDEAMAIADLAAAKNVLVCYELHANTLTDTTASALELLERTNHPAIRAFWQPYNGQTVEECLSCLQTVSPWLHYLHVFHWDPGYVRQPLEEGRDRWLKYLKTIQSKNCPLMLEFVKDDDPRQLSADVSSLREFIEAV